jgi:integral membrane protein (TIGR01906 family)
MRKRRLLISLVTCLITLVVPLWLPLSGVRIVATNAFLHFEYNRADFPADYFGFTEQDRLQYAPYALDYLNNNKGIAYLADLTFPDGKPQYNERELAHMADVKQVAQIAFGFYGILTVVLLISVLFLLRDMTTRNTLFDALAHAGYLTLALILTLLLIAALSWEVFFESFHRLFFPDGTWRFEYSDTLIRLFPERFWSDAALTIGVFTVIGAILLIFAARVGSRLDGKQSDNPGHLQP